ncbi:MULTISPECIES: alpha/beta fold hydrolase [Streptomyces]|uniref:Lysophospholipase n=1 Tax=Streptomyces qinglanensis TaxID=943816 RepID=A0A1E7K6L2_9ACTN|nr:MULTISPECIES: alpha/beta hydrolase [Streptomyces]OEU99486.1 lysophospholipase [Streptomyces qinglanensis]
MAERRDEVTAAADGTPVASYTWWPEGEVRALVQIAHGAAEHALRYERFARRLTAGGYAVVASDHRGHGRTAAATGGYGAAGAEGWRATVADLKEVGDRARSRLPSGAPLFLLGHSMGSQLARDYAQEYGGGLSGLVLSGTFRSLPGCDPEAAVQRLERQVAEEGRDAPSDFTTLLFGSFNDPFTHRTGFEWLSRDPAEVESYAGDERCGFPFGAGLSLDWVRGSRKINDPGQFARIPRELPVHVAVGDQDPCHQGLTLVHELLEDFRHRGTRDLSWRAYPGARHEILNETNRDEVEADLLAWFERHLDAAARG